MIRHLIFFKFKPDVEKSAVQGALESLRALPAQISAIKKFEVGENIIQSARSWDAALIGEYESLPALDEYIKHEAHQAVVAQLGAVCERVASVDYEF